jgi:hypothetical protein
LRFCPSAVSLVASLLVLLYDYSEKKKELLFAFPNFEKGAFSNP